MDRDAVIRLLCEILRGTATLTVAACRGKDALFDDGQIVGTWTWDTNKTSVTYAIIPGYGSTQVDKAAKRQANTLSETLRIRWE